MPFDNHLEAHHASIHYLSRMLNHAACYTFSFTTSVIKFCCCTSNYPKLRGLNHQLLYFLYQISESVGQSLTRFFFWSRGHWWRTLHGIPLMKGQVRCIGFNHMSRTLAQMAGGRTQLAVLTTVPRCGFFNRGFSDSFHGGPGLCQ